MQHKLLFGGLLLHSKAAFKNINHILEESAPGEFGALILQAAPGAHHMHQLVQMRPGGENGDPLWHNRCNSLLICQAFDEVEQHNIPASSMLEQVAFTLLLRGGEMLKHICAIFHQFAPLSCTRDITWAKLHLCVVQAMANNMLNAGVHTETALLS